MLMLHFISVLFKLSESAVTTKEGHDIIDNSSDKPFDYLLEGTLLYVHQEKWQQDLLLKYGNTLSLIDATYKTTKYNIALLFICVKTNVGYSVVAEFIIQSEAS